MTAIALYDYQAAADDEISFDPNDIITNIEMVRKHSCFCASSRDLNIMGKCLRMFRFVQLFLHFRLMMAGGLVNATENLAYSQQTT